MSCDITNANKDTLIRYKNSIISDLNKINEYDKLTSPTQAQEDEINQVYDRRGSEAEAKECLQKIEEALAELDKTTPTGVGTDIESDAEPVSYGPEFNDDTNIKNNDTVQPAKVYPKPEWQDLVEGEKAKNENRFSGYDIKTEQDLENLEGNRGIEQTVDGKGMFTTPWDWRFGDAYTVTKSIGNHMPAGPEWVGSPSIMNPYALIRFAHVAGNRHHVNLIDNAGNNNFRTGGLVRMQMTQADLNKEGQGSTTVPEGETSIADKSQLTQYGIDASNYDDPNYGKVEGIRKDKNGAIYLKYKDESKLIWKTDKSGGPSSKGEKYQLPKDPMVLDSPAVDIKYDPNTSEEFWMTREGLKKCESSEASKIVEGGEIYVIDSGENPCVDFLKDWKETLNKSVNDIDGGQAGKDAAIEKFKDAAIQNWLRVKGQMERGWIKGDHPVTEVPLLSDRMVPLDSSALEPTIDNLCRASSWTGKEQFLYRWSDFLYCNWYDFIPNNRLITLRRFPNPTFDNGAIFGQSTSKKFVRPVATAVTWSGEETGNNLAEILGLSWKINWKDLNAEVNEVQGNELGAGADGSPFGGMATFLGRMNNVATGKGFSAASGWDEQRAKFDPYKDGAYANRVYGPVNVISKTKARERGIETEHSITLKFHYTLRSIGGINPKAAMLDILSNFLALTYSQADFWGGANRYFPNKPQYPFPGGKKGFETWYSGDFEGFLDSMKTQLSQTVGNLANVLQDLLTNPAGALKNLLGGAAKTWMAEKQAKSRPAIVAFKALLTGDPVGEWHLTIGNPFDPIAMFGNMIVTNAKVIFGERLGIDDFPTTMDFEVTLEHGRPRDKGDIESIFNRGEGRLHYAPFGQRTEIWNTTSASQNSKIDTSWNKDGSSKGALSGTSLARGYQNRTTGSEVDTGVRSAIEFGGEAGAHANKLARQLGFESGERKK